MDGDSLILNLDQLYFEDEGSFNLKHLTDKLPADLTSENLLEYKGNLEKVLSVVSRKVSELILSHQPTYVDELQRIANLQKSITDSIRVCTQGRSCLRFIREGAAKNGSTIVEHYKERQTLARTLESLTSINVLRKSISEIRGLIDSQEDFPKAIQMCKDGISMLTSFERYKCVNELGSKLNDTIELIGEQVDTVLSSMCLSYNPTTYSKLQEAYRLMDRREIAVDQLLMHFCSAINSQAHNIVIKYLTQAKKSSVTGLDPDIQVSNQSFKRDFQELCKMLASTQYLDCLLDLCTIFWSIMLNYKRILKWHQVPDRREIYTEKVDPRSEFQHEEQTVDKEAQKGFEDFKKEYVEQKLISGLSRVWYDMKRKLSQVILSHDFSGYRFDEFIKFLSIVELVIRIGNEFCEGQISEDLCDCVNVQALNFFDAYHKSSMDELKMFLENELWEVVPVKADFKLVQLREFSFLRSSSPLQPSIKLTSYQISRHDFRGEERFFDEEVLSYDASHIRSSINNQVLDDSEVKECRVMPFEKVLLSNKDNNEDLFASDLSSSYVNQEEGEAEHREEEEQAVKLDRISLSTDSDEDLCSELNKDYVEEEEFVSSDEDIEKAKPTFHSSDRQLVQRTTESYQPQLSSPRNSGQGSRYSLIRKSGPVLTNSSLNVLRLFGRYIQIMTVLEPISYEILMKIYSILDYYIMIVYRKFGPDSDKKPDNKNVSPKLKFVIRSIRESLIGGNQMESATKLSDTDKFQVQQGPPNISNLISSDFSPTSQRQLEPIEPRKAVAVESLIYLVNQLWNLQEYLESLIPADKRPQLREQFSQANSIVPDFLKARAEIDSSLTFNVAGQTL